MRASSTPKHISPMRFWSLCGAEALLKSRIDEAFIRRLCRECRVDSALRATTAILHFQVEHTVEYYLFAQLKLTIRTITHCVGSLAAKLQSIRQNEQDRLETAPSEIRARKRAQGQWSGVTGRGWRLLPSSQLALPSLFACWLDIASISTFPSSGKSVIAPYLMRRSLISSLAPQTIAITNIGIPVCSTLAPSASKYSNSSFLCPWTHCSTTVPKWPKRLFLAVGSCVRMMRQMGTLAPVRAERRKGSVLRYLVRLECWRRM